MCETILSAPRLVPGLAPGVFGTPRDAVAYLRPLIEAGLRYVVVNLAAFDDLETPRLLTEQVLPELHALAATRSTP